MYLGPGAAWDLHKGRLDWDWDTIAGIVQPQNCGRR